MKQIRIIAVLVMAMLVNSGCEKELIDYTGTEGVYFGVRRGSSWNTDPKNETFRPDSYLEFIMLEGDHYNMEIPILITGGLKDYRRSVNVAVDKELSTGVEGVDYVFEQTVCYVEPGENRTSVSIRINRTARMEDEEVSVTLKLIPNDDFILAFEVFDQPGDLTSIDSGMEIPTGFDNSKHTIYANDILVEPPTWLGFTATTGYENHTLGRFSAKKFRLLMEVTGTELLEWWDSDVMVYARVQYCTRQMAIYLVEQYRRGLEHVVMEDDGRIMWVEHVLWASTMYGETWDPSTYDPNL